MNRVKNNSKVAMLAAMFAMILTSTAFASTAAELVTQINGYGLGEGKGTALSAVASGNTVTVTGNVADAAIQLMLNIDSAVTVVWRATLGTSSPIIWMVNLDGGGTFNMKSGKISAIAGNAIYNGGTGSVNISGGTVSATTGNAIYNRSVGSVNISGGTVSAAKEGFAVYNSGDGKITISKTAKVTPKYDAKRELQSSNYPGAW
ncbi:MAG: hypothetical protein LBH25_11770 [Fibromonadaceae bacterium]|jgi:hypothetical protein|nr:hypothetical protein [Fibromonadaceae bacterium]